MRPAWKQGVGVSLLYCVGVGIYFFNACLGVLVMGAISVYLLWKYPVMDFPGEHPPELLVRGHSCLACGYDLRDLPGQVCPECGTPFVLPDPPC